MREELQNWLTTATNDLSKELDPDNDLRPLLASTKCFTETQLESIYNPFVNPTRSARVQALIYYLKLSEDSSYTVFRDCLVNIGRRSLAERCLPVSDTSTGACETDRRNDRLVKKEIGLTRFLTTNRLLHVLSNNGGKTAGLTVLGSNLYAARHTPHVSVYKSDDFALIRNITIAGSNQISELISCSRYNCLYAVDTFQKIVFRHDLASCVTTNWSVSDKCFRLSVTKCCNILATLYFTRRIQEYTTHGSLIREICLDSSVDGSWHCLELFSGNYVVSHTGLHQYRICTVDQSGRVILSYGESPGSSVGQLSYPYHLSVDLHDNTLVADYGNNRVQLLSPTLTYLGDIVIPGHTLSGPYALHFDEQNHRLYIGDANGIFIIE